MAIGRRWRRLVVATLTFAFAVMPALASAAASDPVTIDFEDAPASRSGTPAANPITDRYRAAGVVFTTPVTPLRFDGTSIPRGPLARSGDVAVTTCYAQEFCSNRIELRLTSATERVTLWVGSSSELRTATTITMEGRDAKGRLLDQAAVRLGPSTAPIGVSQSLEVSDVKGTLAQVMVSGALSSLLIDDLTVAPYVLVPRLAFDPIRLDVQAEAGEATPTSVQLTNLGDTAVALPSIAVEGDGASLWSVDTSTCPRTLASNRSCRVDLGFRPTATGSVETRLVARDPSNKVLASASLVVTVLASTSTTIPATTSATAAPPPTTGGDTGTPTTADGSETTSTRPGRSDPTKPIALVLIVLVALILGVAGARRHRTDRVAPQAGPAPTVRPRLGPRQSALQPTQPHQGPIVAVVIRMPPASRQLTVIEGSNHDNPR